MGNANFSDDFKRDAVAQISERGYPVAEVSQRLGVSQHSLYEWKKKFSQRSSHGTRALSCRHRTGLLANPIFAAATIGFGASRLQSYEAGHCWGAHTASGGWIAAMASAPVARYRLRPPLRTTSRHTDDGARPIRSAIDRNDSQALRPRDISSRSVIVSDRRLRRRSTGAMPPLARNTPKTEPACLPRHRPISLSECPHFHRRQSSRFSSDDSPGRPVRAIVDPPSASRQPSCCVDRLNSPRVFRQGCKVRYA